MIEYILATPWLLTAIVLVASLVFGLIGGRAYAAMADENPWPLFWLVFFTWPIVVPGALATTLLFLMYLAMDKLIKL